ncbi:PepSY domain-containing protein [Pseudomonas sp. ZM23]|uniref:PepSY domain-containing protein n=2 Tax=Pseudomonas triclosanedens TaxID=2961893 RepID=A0ABY6ZRY9_9PSED|nr:PepSY domain-containing protein [Pseudomonas triclosanedens]MCP8467167.1 PepSY domain-containing protein [Pseudomonas triclosanedens]MCP8472684.1 PepSY domain-containing protein [Pseudomonas triclosanedens]MCP8478115.1 PepSY domain-containing protein [Pseudomonas triclosanedens]WAI47525.1 PepSY domain-containing protein [Pseudomonas triclosanedens]
MKIDLPRSVLFAVAFAMTAGAAQAHDLSQDEALRLSREGVIRPFEEILPIALGLYPGSKLLEAELEKEHDTYIYEVELLTVDGVVRELELDARDGRILKDKEDD